MPEEEAPTTWHTKETLRLQWANAPKDDALLDELLAVAKHQVLEFAPTLEEDAEVPDHYRLGQMLQARALWESQNAKTSQDIDAIGGEYQVRVYPMSGTIRSVLRPSTGFKVIG